MQSGYTSKQDIHAGRIHKQAGQTGRPDTQAGRTCRPAGYIGRQDIKAGRTYLQAGRTPGGRQSTDSFVHADIGDTDFYF
jgi:hypothetical protein